MKNINNTSNAIQIDYFDNIEIKLTSEVKNFHAGTISKNQILETFKRIDTLPFSNINIKFSDDIWDFRYTTNLPISNHALVFKFNNKSNYCEILKMYVLNEIIKKATKIRVLNNKFRVISKYLTFFENEGYTTFDKIPKSSYKKFLKSLETTCSYNTICSYNGIMLLFIEFYERTFKELKDQNIKKYLGNKDLSKIKNIKESNKTPEVPIEYFPIFIDGIKKIMRNDNETNEDRITAASIILFTQIGFRTSEMLTLKANSLKSIYSPNKNKKLYYINFLSFKHGKGENGSTIAHTYINDLSLEAYNILMELCKDNRERLNTDILFVTKLQNNKQYASTTYSVRYRKFIVRHWKELKCLNIDNEYENLESIEVRNIFKRAKDGTYNYDRNADWAKDLKMDDRIFYPAIRQFRVSVCTNLYRQHIPMHYIKKHMNHLSEDMTSYYIRPKENIEKEYSETIYRAVYKDGSKMLGKNADAFIEKINEFINENNLNIKNNIDEVVDIISDKFPLRSKVGGLCIRCGDVIPCASNSSTDDIYCAFGMCKNHCHMFFMIDISYADYLKHLKLLKYNREHNRKKAYQKETNKLKYILENSLIPELTMLEEELNKNGKENIIKKYPQITDIVNNFDSIKEEVLLWMQNQE